MYWPVYIALLEDRSIIVDNGVYEEFTSVSDHIYNGLFSISEDGFRTKRITHFCKLFRRYQNFPKKFHQLRNYLYTTGAQHNDG